MFILADLKIARREDLAMLLLAAMNGFLTFVKNQKLNVPIVLIVIFFRSLMKSLKLISWELIVPEKNLSWEFIPCCLMKPVSWKGTIAQYVERLHRLHDFKKEVQVYDKEAYRCDRRKDMLLQENGYTVLRFLAEDLGTHLHSVLDSILRTLIVQQGRSKSTQ